MLRRGASRLISSASPQSRLGPAPLRAGYTHLQIAPFSSCTTFRFKLTSVMEAPKASSSSQPPWVAPIPTKEEPQLRVYNSLTRSKDLFVPRRGKRVDWYNCGPTVYDASHMGHARNYLTQDIIRRILQDYFGYDVNFVMNVTDIDDKIILRARESHLLDETITNHRSLTPDLVETSVKAYAIFLAKVLAKLPTPISSDASQDPFGAFEELARRDETDVEFARTMREKEEKWTLYLSSLRKSATAIQAAQQQLKNQQTNEGSVRELVEGAADVLGPYLGETRAETIADPVGVSRKLAAYWEGRFFEDMDRLHVLPPDTITRVSEYVPEIVTFVQKIVENGFAYEGEGSVWFDVAKFEGAEGDGWRHEYAKLQPGNKGNKKLLDEGEGALVDNRGKRQAADFALWKAKSKPGEPSWPSPWGDGRPGWHIECSVMASAVVGDGMDIHSGGVDLMFPHHDNELAQSEAYHGCRQWVNYFLHTGHLHIEGLKMSKSLKNFITIDDALRDYSARRLRLAFMLQTWNARLDFKKDLMADVKAKEETIDNFFTNVKARLTASANQVSDGKHHFDDPEKALDAALHTAQDDFRISLCDSFNTPAAISVIMDLIAKVNIYYANRGREVNMEPVRAIAEWVTRMLRMFGLGEGSYSEGQIGWGSATADGASGDFEAALDKYLKAMSSFRDELRKIAIAGGSNADILALCDRFRDQDLVNIGVQLDDGQGADGGALYKLVDPSVLIRQREEKAAQAADKAAKKAAAAAAAEEKRLAQLEKGRVPPSEMFRPPNVPEGTYTQWDESGLPTHDGEGKEVSKSQSKKFAKESKIQEKAHEAWLAYHKGK